ncbi:hypothetical protein WN48_07074 [Eufriesea mexicana]|uniref:Pre-C2HC domain-containing protein n=1 Tax=Eufriesea mexicana TaxID=516756 RepID=A0A310SVL2_9HYME|nr:hypothetical protein WN48_07074 [Eufriesea mexicana]
MEKYKPPLARHSKDSNQGQGYIDTDSEREIIMKEWNLPKTINRKRLTKITNDIEEKTKCLTDHTPTPTSNTYEVLNHASKFPTKETKPPPIFIEAHIVNPLMELLNQLLGRKSYGIRNLENNQIKIQTATFDNYRKLIKALRCKRCKRCKLLHLLQGHQALSIINLTKSETSVPLPMFLMELAAAGNNKEIYNNNLICNTIDAIKAARVKRNIPQCTSKSSNGILSTPEMDSQANKT